MGTSSGPFAGTTPLGVQERLCRRFGWVPGELRPWRRALQFVLCAWLVPALLTLFEIPTRGLEATQDFLFDFGMYARFLVALPLLVAGAPFAGKCLEQVAGHLLAGEQLAPADVTRLRARLEHLAALRDAGTARAAIIMLALFTSVAVLLGTEPDIWPPWQRSAAGGLTLAAMWHISVSLPLLLALLAGWTWRWARWAWFMLQVARAPLLLLATHPDRCGGLRYLLQSTLAWLPAAAASGAIVAGTMANGIFERHESLAEYQVIVVVLVVIMLLVAFGPLLPFTPRLIQNWRRGTLEYDALASRVGRELERAWISRDAQGKALESPAFSATTDLYAVVANVNAMRPVLLDLRSTLLVVVATLLPFLPVVLGSAPLRETLGKLLGALL